MDPRDSILIVVITAGIVSLMVGFILITHAYTSRVNSSLCTRAIYAALDTDNEEEAAQRVELLEFAVKSCKK